jgi:hypothetical protein
MSTSTKDEIKGTRAMVLLIEIDVAGAFRTDRSEWHRDSPLLSAGWGLMFVG